MNVRATPNSKAIMIIGQDESIFHQYSLVTKQWVGPEGQRALLPKSEGAGYMIFAFQCREVGMLQIIGMEDLSAINTKRLETNYIATEAAIYINGNTAKPPLTSSPFLV